MPICNCNTSIMDNDSNNKYRHLKHGLTDEYSHRHDDTAGCSLSIYNLSCVCLHCLCTDAWVFTVERCQHRRPRFGGAVRQTRFGPICQKTAASPCEAAAVITREQSAILARNANAAHAGTHYFMVALCNRETIYIFIL